jgi:hypothetical protein
MKKFCGKQFVVKKNLDRIFVEGMGNRRIENTVILDKVTCDGNSHGKCQRSCTLLWKESWLKEVTDDSYATIGKDFHPKYPAKKTQFDTKTICQMTELPNATLRYVCTLDDLLRQCIPYFHNPKVPWQLEAIIDFLPCVCFKATKPFRSRKREEIYGKLRKTPALSLNVRPGDFVQVKEKKDILETLDFTGKNRGLSFTPEMLKYCGGHYRVLKRIDRIMSEKRKRIRHLANTVILEGVVCDGTYHENCPLCCYLLWREIWLKKTNASESD